jgi:hypothetical protein
MNEAKSLAACSIPDAIVSANRTSEHNPPANTQPLSPLFEICISSNEKLANFLSKVAQDEQRRGEGALE